jgi:hypothetical protein
MPLATLADGITPVPCRRGHDVESAIQHADEGHERGFPAWAAPMVLFSRGLRATEDTPPHRIRERAHTDAPEVTGCSPVSGPRGDER